MIVLKVMILSFIYILYTYGGRDISVGTQMQCQYPVSETRVSAWLKEYNLWEYSTVWCSISKQKAHIRSKKEKKQTCFSAVGFFCCTMLFFVWFLFSHHTWKYNEVLYISADVRTPKTVNLKVLAPRVNQSFLKIYIFLTSLSTNPS